MRSRRWVQTSSISSESMFLINITDASRLTAICDQRVQMSSTVPSPTRRRVTNPLCLPDLEYVVPNVKLKLAKTRQRCSWDCQTLQPSGLMFGITIIASNFQCLDIRKEF